MSSRTSMIKMGEHISFLRKKKNYTQRNLGDILDVSDKTISKWEKGIVAPDITILQALANTLDVSVEEILAGEKVSHINTIEALDIYSNMTKHKLVRSFIVFITFLAIFSQFAAILESSRNRRILISSSITLSSLTFSSYTSGATYQS